MTTQQSSNLHPFVYEIKLVDKQQYPDIVRQDLISQENTNFVIANDFNIYTTTVLNDKLSIIRLQRQDYHQHYFVPATVIDETNTPVTIDVEEGITHAPYLSYNHVNQKLYFMYNNASNAHTIEQYTVESTGRNILTNDWSTTITGLDIDEQRNRSGFMLGEDILYSYIYSPTLGVVSIYSTIKSTGDTALHKNITGMSTGLNSLEIKLNYDESTLYITTISNKLHVLVATLNDTDSAPMATVTMSEQLGVVQPATTILNEDVLNVIYGFNNDTANQLHISNINGSISSDGDIVGLNTPFRYNLNKLLSYEEELNVDQTNLTIAHTNNIYNPNFSYFAYISGTSQIRVVKLYHHRQQGTTLEKYIPLMMWSTRLGAIDYYYGTDNEAGGIQLLSDSAGRIYVFARNGVTGLIKMWVVEEFIIDLGHTAGTVTASVDTMTDLLSSIRDEYTIVNPETYSFGITGYPSVNDVIITQVTEEGSDTRVRFEYIDYDMLVLYPEIKSEIQDDIRTAVTELYQSSNIDVYDIGSGTIPEGDNSHIVFALPRGTLLRPCVVKGTNVVTCDKNGSNIKSIPIELVHEHSYVVNQSGKAVKVIKHMNSKIWCQKHNAPFIIPVNFFGEHRPYEKLLISGDHGLLVANKGNGKVNVAYAQNISCLRQVKLEQEIEYHHLLLDEHDKNFFMANGLEVDSLHPGMYMKR